MRLTRRNNRISALLIALLYVFFSTFGAVTHTHAIPDTDRSLSASLRKGTGPPEAAMVHSGKSSPSDCAACDWQALSVTLVGPPPPVAATLLLRMVRPMPVFAFDAVAIARFSSRAPPTA